MTSKMAKMMAQPKKADKVKIRNDRAGLSTDEDSGDEADKVVAVKKPRKRKASGISPIPFFSLALI